MIETSSFFHAGILSEFGAEFVPIDEPVLGMEGSVVYCDVTG
jgi:hypothetical protein